MAQHQAKEPGPNRTIPKFKVRGDNPLSEILMIKQRLHCDVVKSCYFTHIDLNYIYDKH